MLISVFVWEKIQSFDQAIARSFQEISVQNFAIDVISSKKQNLHGLFSQPFLQSTQDQPKQFYDLLED